MSLTHLNLYSGYSLMKSTITIERLVEHAKQLNFTSLALTDEHVLYGVIPFYKACLANDMKPIIGMTTQFEVGESFFEAVLLAKSNKGYRNLLKLSTNKQINDIAFTVESLNHLGEGLFILIKTTKGIIEEQLKTLNFESVYSVYEQLLTYISKENVYFAIENARLQSQSLIHDRLQQFTEQYEINNVVALHETRYLNEKDMYSYACLRAMERGERWDIEKLDYTVKNKYFLTKEEMNERFSFWPEALHATEHIANCCNVSIEMDKLHLPKFPLKDGETAAETLKTLCFKRITYRYADVTDEIKNRLTYELDVIESLGFSDYFLIVADFVSYAKRQNILVGPGRGSAAGSLVSYVLGITNVDPIKYNLLFERFLNPERTSLPDIDIDFSDERRDEVIRYVQEKYGHEHVAQIITFGTFGARSLLRELMKTLNINEHDQNYLLKHIPTQTSKSIITHVNDSYELKQYVKRSKKLRLLFHIAQRLEGLPRHISTHAAGIVISGEKLVNYTPLTLGQDTLYLTQFAMNDLEAVGLVKIDLLGLRNLSLIERIVKAIERIERKKIDLTKIDAHDLKTFQLLQRGKTNGIFQLESAGMKRLLKQLKPNVFEDIVALNALYRPGPMAQIPTYIARKHGRESFSYLHPDLEPILKETYGVLIYQEQIMQIAHRLAGFSLGKADLLRRAMSKKKHRLMEEQKDAFIQGCVANGYHENIAKQLFSWIETFANYGFNKSHSVAYSKIAYQLSYLKAHYPHIFFTQLLSTVANDRAKLTQYVKEATDLNITILPPSINKSYGQFSVEGSRIRIGLYTIKGIGRETVNEIVRVRKERPFTDLFDFCLRVSQQVIKRNTIETLILAGAFDELYKNRASLLASIDEALDRAELFGSRDGQASLFSEQLEMRTPHYVELDDFPQMKKLADEKELIGLYVSEHPLKSDRPTLDFNDYETIEQTKKLPVKYRLKLVAIIQQVKKIRTKRGESMAFLTISDETGETDVVIFPDLFRQVRQLLEEGLIIDGQYTVSERNGNKQLIANMIQIFQKERLKLISNEQLYLRFTENMGHEKIKKLRQIVKKHPGNVTIIVYYEKQKQSYRLGKDYLIEVNAEVMAQLNEVFGKENVVLKEVKL